MVTTIIFLIVLSILVFIHELGHFLFAKLFKVRVDEFAIGFPPKIFSFKKGETTYALNMVPLGGYVKIHGENPDDVVDPQDSRNFQNISWWKQVIVLVAGVTFNVIFAWILLSMSLMIGTSKAAVEGVPTQYVKGDTKVFIQQVIPESPAEKAGIKPGDVILSVDAVTVTASVEVQSLIKEAEKTATVVVERGGATSSHVVTFEKENMMGVNLAEVGLVQMPLFPALKHGFLGTIYLTEEIGKGVTSFFSKVFVGGASWDQVSGPVGIAKSVGEASRDGFSALLFISVLISISLAIMNILPFPALDGGRIVIALIEGVIRKKIKPSIVNTINSIGFIVLIGLMLVVTFKDIF